MSTEKPPPTLRRHFNVAKRKRNTRFKLRLSFVIAPSDVLHSIFFNENNVRVGLL